MLTTRLPPETAEQAWSTEPSIVAQRGVREPLGPSTTSRTPMVASAGSARTRQRRLLDGGGGWQDVGGVGAEPGDGHGLVRQGLQSLIGGLIGGGEPGRPSRMTRSPAGGALIRLHLAEVAFLPSPRGCAPTGRRPPPAWRPRPAPRRAGSGPALQLRPRADDPSRGRLAGRDPSATTSHQNLAGEPGPPRPHGGLPCAVAGAQVHGSAHAVHGREDVEGHAGEVHPRWSAPSPF